MISEIDAFVKFRDALGEHMGLEWTDWKRPKNDPPDYWLKLENKQRIGVEVTTLKACEKLLAANARMQKINEYLRQEARQRLSIPVELIFEPYATSSLPPKTEQRACFEPLWSYLGEGPPTTRYGVDCSIGKVWVKRLPSKMGDGVRVVDQRFFMNPNIGNWRKHINETIMFKVRRYGRSPCKPFWLLLNLKPYLPDKNSARALLQTGVPIDSGSEVSPVFDRIYVLTGYIPTVGDQPVCPISRLL